LRDMPSIPGVLEPIFMDRFSTSTIRKALDLIY
jgi:hypothetical protein